MDKSAFRRMFLQLDAPIVAELVSVIANLNGEATEELRHKAALLCHRIRGDAVSVGFLALGELVWRMEKILREPGDSRLEERLTSLRTAATELSRRVEAGEAECEQPLPDFLRPDAA